MSHHKDDPEKMAQLERWLKAASDALDFDYDVIAEHQKELLSLISVVAHGPSRPGAPLTAYIVGYVAASTGADTADLANTLKRLADDFS